MHGCVRSKLRLAIVRHLLLFVTERALYQVELWVIKHLLAFEIDFALYDPIITLNIRVID